MKQFKAVYPISGEDLSALPVRAIGPAVAFYQSVLGFSVVASDEATATLQRDDVRSRRMVVLSWLPRSDFHSIRFRKHRIRH